MISIILKIGYFKKKIKYFFFEFVHLLQGKTSDLYALQCIMFLQEIFQQVFASSASNELRTYLKRTGR